MVVRQATSQLPQYTAIHRKVRCFFLCSQETTGMLPGNDPHTAGYRPLFQRSQDNHDDASLFTAVLTIATHRTYRNSRVARITTQHEISLFSYKLNPICLYTQPSTSLHLRSFIPECKQVYSHFTFQRNSLMRQIKYARFK